MNHRGGWALIKSTWASWMQYRSFFFVLAFGWMIPPLLFCFVWSSLAGDAGLAGLTRGEFIAYYLILILVNQLTFTQTNWTLGDVIRMGSVNFWLIRPMSPVYHVLASEVAGKIVMMSFAIPVVVILACVLHPELHPSTEALALFLPALAIAWLLRFFWGCSLALLAFWFSRADALLNVQDTLVFLLAGVVAPVPMLPGIMQRAAVWLPFRFMVGFPVEVFSGRLSSSELINGFILGLGWMIFAACAAGVTWKFGLKSYTAVGG